MCTQEMAQSMIKKGRSKRTTGKLPIKIKVAAGTALLNKIKFNQVDQVHLMDGEEVAKHDELHELLGKQDPQHTQLNLNYLIVTAISDLDKRMEALEKKVRLHFAEKRDSNKKAKAKGGVKRKLGEAFDSCGEDSNSGFPSDSEPGKASTSTQTDGDEAEEGEVGECGTQSCNDGADV
jgi:hypothetical protein